MTRSRIARLRKEAPMLGRSRIWLAAALVAGSLTSDVFAQSPNLPVQPIPVPAQPDSTQPMPPITVPPIQVPPNNNAVVPMTPVFGTPTPTLPPPIPPSAAACPERGFYGSLELLVLFPHLRGTLGGSVSVQGSTDSFSITNPQLNSTGSPVVEIGYRLGDGLGAVALSYRSTVSRGGFTVPNWDVLGTGFVATRLNMNVVDLDYVSPAYNVVPFWDVAWRAGLRGAAIYYNDQVTGGFIDVNASNNFLGAGPHATIEGARILDLIPGLAVTSKLDGGVVIGQVSQSFDERFTFADGTQVGGANRIHSTQAAPMMIFQFGLSYTPPSWVNWARFGFGYQFEYWWDIGTGGASRGDYYSNGIYFRGEINF
jgi:hypothetical protein